MHTHNNLTVFYCTIHTVLADQDTPVDLGGTLTTVETLEGILAVHNQPSLC